MRIGILGLGAVGSAIQRAFTEYTNFEIKTHDIKHNHSSIKDLLSTDFIFICLPTELTDTNTCDTSKVENAIDELHQNNYKGIVIIKSTVIPGTTKKLLEKYNLQISFVPEFLRQRFAFEDLMSDENVLIVGTENEKTFQNVCKIHNSFIKKFKKLSPTEAELSKYFCNTFNSVRVTFANIFYEVSAKFHCDYNQVLEAIQDGPLYMYGDYLKCNKDLRGFSGSCLPKDLQAFTTFLQENNLFYDLLLAAKNDNEYFK